jgi:hypothetical protein
MSFCHHLASVLRSSVSFSHINLLLKIHWVFFFAGMMYKSSFPTFRLNYQLWKVLYKVHRVILTKHMVDTGTCNHVSNFLFETRNASRCQNDWKSGLAIIVKPIDTIYYLSDFLKYHN